MDSTKLFSAPKVSTMAPGMKSKVAELRDLVKGIKNKDYKDKANTIIDLYQSRQITNFRTAENSLVRLSQPRSIKSGRADAEYNRIVSKYSDALPSTGRLERESLKKKHNVYSATLVLYKKGEEWEPSDKKVRQTKGLKQFYIGSFNVVLNAFEMKYLTDLLEKVVRRDENPKPFKEMIKIFSSKNLVFQDLMDSTGQTYLAGMLLMKVAKVDTDTLNFEPKKQRNKDTSKVGAYYMYSCTPMDLTKNTFKEAIQNMNYTKDECFINTLYDFYRDNLLNPDKTRNVITRDDILKTINKTEDNVKDGISIEDIVPFFAKHRLQLRVFDQFYHEVFKYEPAQRNHHNKAMYCMMADGHIYTLNHNIKRLEQKQDSECEEIKPLTTTNDYVIKEDAKPIEARMIDNIDDIVTIAKTIVKVDKGIQVVNLIHRQDNLMMLLNDLREAGYNPGINFEAGRLTALKLSLNGIFFVIQTQQLIKSAIDGVVVVDDEATYNTMSQAMTSFNHKIFLNGHKSFYTDSDLDVLDEYRTKPIVGNLKTPMNDMVEIDISKAYTSALSSIAEIPIFNEFDNFIPYDGSAIQALNLYIVHAPNHPLTTQDKCLVYGQFLKSNHQIIAYKKPSFIKHVDYKTAIQELFDSTISEDKNQDTHIKKLIANVNIGLLEKCFNRKTRGHLFQDLAECQYYQAKMGGAIHMLNMIETVEETNDLGLDDGLDSQPITSYSLRNSDKPPLYVLVLKAESQLKNGFRYIKELLLQSHNFKLMDAFDKLQANNIPVCSVKTDCFTIRASDLSRAQHLLSFDQRIGSWRLSKKGADILYPYDSITVRQLKNFQFTKPVSKEIKVKDEWDTNEFCNIFEANKRVMVRAEYAGCGKSYACKALENRGHKVLFVCPTNKLAQNNLNNGVTLHNFFGLGITAEQQVSKFDASSYDVIVFDEIYFANIRMLARIKKYCEANPDKIIVATGDTNQLECIDLISNNINYDEYMNHCIDIIFTNNIHLKTNKRLKTEKDRETLKSFKRDCFDESVSITQIVNKYFKQTDSITTTDNIAYTNNTCDRVSSIVRQNLGKQNDYEVGEKLVCRKFVKEGDYKFRVNFEFSILENNDNTLILQDGDDTVEVRKSTVEKFFVYNYCRTCHSFQGSSIDDKITIFDWRFKFVNRKWLYTAVTRATDLKNVVFYSGKDEGYDDRLLQKYLDLKVQHYKRQDKESKRKISSNFITAHWLKDQFGKSCPGCGDCLTFEIKGGKVESNLTADRFDNDLDHNLENITPLCCTCNQRKSKW